MENKSYRNSIQVNGSGDEAMKKIAQINFWWKNDFSGSAERPGDRFTVPFGELNGESSFVDFIVTNIIPGQKAVWTVTDCYLPWFNDKKEWNGTELVFELSEENGRTKIDFTHVGLIPDIECYTACEQGWNGHITDGLANFINDGITISQK
jgi:hypothetical protein